MKRQPDFDRFRSTLLLEEIPGKAPLFDVAEPDFMTSWLGKNVDNLDTAAEFFMKAGYDYVRFGIDLWQSQQAEKIKPHIHGHIEHKWPDGLKSYACPDMSKLDLSSAANMRLPDGMKAVADIGQIFTVVWGILGFQAFGKALYENPTMVKELTELIASRAYEATIKICELEIVGALVINDDLAHSRGLMVSPHHLKEFFFPHYERICKLAKKHKIPVIFHSDGNVTEILNDLIAIGFNGLHPIDPHAMDIKETRRIVGNKLCLLGAIDFCLLTKGTIGQITDHVRTVISDTGKGGYCPGACSILDKTVKTENYNAMRSVIVGL